MKYIYNCLTTHYAGPGQRVEGGQADGQREAPGDS